MDQDHFTVSVWQHCDYNKTIEDVKILYKRPELQTNA